MIKEKFNSGGLTVAEAEELQQRYGRNELVSQKKQAFVIRLLRVLSEPMFMLLLTAAVIYFFLGEPRDGFVMLVFVIGIISIDFIQELKTDRTLNALKDLSAPYINVLRDGKETQIASADLVPGDIMMIHEGVKIPADGYVLKCNDLCVDESALTGESEGVWKTAYKTSHTKAEHRHKDYCYAGTFVTQGTAVIYVDKIGSATSYGKIGVSVAEAHEEDTPLQKQTGKLVKLCAGIAAVLFVFVAVVTWFNIPKHTFTDRLTESILSGITLAMAMIPEEFPVILTVFLSMGAWRLAKKQSLVRRLPSVETLGAISVLCVDKTGTLTLNQMTVQEVWPINGDVFRLCEVMGLGCETEAYDPMEKAMLTHCDSYGITREKLFDGELITEYAFTNTLKMMGHVWRRKGELIIAAKGSPESILTICALSAAEAEEIQQKINAFSVEGLRVIAVAAAYPENESNIPKKLTDCALTFCGLIGLSDPPRATVKNDIANCSKAGIRVVMITGDNGLTAASIANKTGISNPDNIITGDMIEKMTDDELREKVKTTNIFSRVTPEHKMRIVRAFRANGDIVAMTGDGVNDAPALKYADIGIAMGKRGSEVSREAADLILMDDNFTTIVDTVRDGRRIYDNIRKAVGYVFTIHIPIALTSLLAPMLGIEPSSLMLLPLHVVLLELIIDPTCSIVLERQPAETEIMERMPRNPKERLLNSRILLKSILQGITVFAASFGIYLYMLSQSPSGEAVARSMGLAVIMLANLFLVLGSSSDTDSAFVSFKRLAGDKVMRLVSLITILGLLTVLYTPLSGFLKLAPLSGVQFLIILSLAAVSVFWYELLKLVRRIKLSH